LLIEKQNHDATILSSEFSPLPGQAPSTPSRDSAKIVIPSAAKRGRPIAKLDLAPGAVTPEDVRQAFADARCDIPPEPELVRLAGIFSQYKLVFLDARRDAEYTDAARQAADAAKILQAALAPMLAYLAANHAAGDPFAIHTGQELSKLRERIKDAAPYLGWVPVVPGCEVKDWRWFINQIVRLIKSSVPDAGLSKGSPIPRILSRIIPIVCGNEVTPASIAKQFLQLSTGKK
jgi:hypothetical protein